MLSVDVMAPFTEVPLDSGWELTRLAAGVATTTDELTLLSPEWLKAEVPGTFASALRAAGRFAYDFSQSYDDADIWFRRSGVDLGDVSSGVQLCFGGLATLAEVFWNGERVLSSRSMFVAHTVDLTGRAPRGDLLIRFRSLSADLKATKRSRPRWKTKLVNQQQLRFIRTSLLGRIPSWCPPVAPVGPYRPVTIRRPQLAPVALDLKTTVAGDRGIVTVALSLAAGDTLRPSRAVLEVGGQRATTTFSRDDRGRLQGSLRVEIPQVELWWPHTHGSQPTYPARLLVECQHGATADGGTTQVAIPIGDLAFRTIAVDRQDGGFTVAVNGREVFCRGACWTPVDLISLGDLGGATKATLLAAKAAGMNMIRMGGTMVYEPDEFYGLCQELGILVWQDFMFANMDYPVQDQAFMAEVEEEIRQFLTRTQRFACLAILCGNSEAEQQAAMMGLAEREYQNELFGRLLPEWCQLLRPDTVYVSSSATGGTLPFQANDTITHYYGVGAYKRPFDDARRADVRFTSECLGFANVPEDETLDELLSDGSAPFHSPLWKQRTPRDSGVGWDFDDVRDFYTRLLFDKDPVHLRSVDPQAYLALSRNASGEAMARTLREWRRVGSRCSGAIIWWLRDLWPGAGWGLIDALGRPKAAYWQVRRVLAPLTVLITDEGLNGLAIHVVNDLPQSWQGKLVLRLLRHGHQLVHEASVTVDMAPHSKASFTAEAMIGRFVDSAYAYRFGPPNHQVAVASLLADGHEAPLATDCHFPVGYDLTPRADLGLTGTLEASGDHYLLRLEAKVTAQFVAITASGFRPDDNHLHVTPGSPQLVPLRPLPATKPGAVPKGTLSALNGSSTVKMTLAAPAAP